MWKLEVRTWKFVPPWVRMYPKSMSVSFIIPVRTLLVVFLLSIFANVDTSQLLSPSALLDRIAGWHADRISHGCDHPISLRTSRLSTAQQSPRNHDDPPPSRCAFPSTPLWTQQTRWDNSSLTLTSGSQEHSEPDLPTPPCHQLLGFIAKWQLWKESKLWEVPGYANRCRNFETASKMVRYPLLKDKMGHARESVPSSYN